MTALPSVLTGLAGQLTALHAEAREDPDMAGLGRVAVAVYDSHSGQVATFLHSSDGESPLDNATAPLSRLTTLAELAERREERTINDLIAYCHDGHDYARRLIEYGYRSSHTRPIVNARGLYGFLFFNSRETGFFSPLVLRRLRPYGEAIAQMVIRELDALRGIQATVRILLQISAVRDGETGAHLARMAGYARAIAARLAPRHGFNDEFVEYLFEFAPVHDVGKISVPDHILRKPGPLTVAEFEIMKGHVNRGVEIVDLALGGDGFMPSAHQQMLRNIVAGHHERFDGGGYPNGIAGLGIPFEARIVSVADVFDALTSRRPYKPAWDNETAMATIVAGAGSQFDPDCVAALRTCGREIEEIQRCFVETAVP